MSTTGVSPAFAELRRAGQKRPRICRNFCAENGVARRAPPQLRPSEQPAGIDVARQAAVRHAAQIVHPVSVGTIIKSWPSGITSEWKTTGRRRAVTRCFFLGDGVPDERAAGCANRRADGSALHVAGRRPADNRACRCAVTRALSGVSITRIQGESAQRQSRNSR